MGRERVLTVMVAGWVVLAVVRLWPSANSPIGLPCSPGSVGRSGERAVCGGAETLGGGERRVLGLPLDLNVATEAELEALPGVGPALAARIIASRTSEGPFGRLDDLERVSGIGAGKVRLLEGRATARRGGERDEGGIVSGLPGRVSGQR